MKTAVIYFLLLLLFVLTGSAAAEAGKDENPDYWRIGSGDYWAGYFKDTGRILSAPPRWDGKDWVKAGFIFGATAGLYAFDDGLQDWVQENKTNLTEDVASFAKPFGEIGYVAPPIVALYAYGSLAENEKARRVSLVSLESYAVTGLFTQALKFSLHRHRPRSGDPPDTFDGPEADTDGRFLSFPSGHASSVWSVMTVYATEYEEYAVIPPLCYGIATLTSLSRVHDNAHWASDAFFGSALGYLTAKAVIGYHDKEKTTALLPLLTGDATGLLIAYRF